MTPSRRPPTPWKGLLFGAAVIIVFTLIAYWPAIRAGFIWDDDDMLTQNPIVQTPNGLAAMWNPLAKDNFFDFIPLTLTSFWIEWRLWQMNPAGYHITNIVLHALSAILFWRALRYLKVPGAWVIGLAFALHPVNVQSVAWITERKNTLALVFYALTLVCYLRWETANDGAASANKSLSTQLSTFNPQLLYWFSLAAFILGLLSKGAIVMLPFVLLGCIWWLRGAITKRDFFRTLPFFGASFLFAAMTIWFQYSRAISTDVVRTGTFLSRLTVAGNAVWFYLLKAVLPIQLAFIYPRWEIDPNSALAYLPGLAALLLLGVFFRFRETWGRPLLFAWGYFVVTLFPVLGFFNIYFQKYTLVADYWQYPSIIGMIALLIGFGAYAGKKFPALRFAAVPLIALLGYLTWEQSKIYKDDVTLFRDTIAKNPKSWMAHSTLGVALLQLKQYDDALREFQTTIAIKPDHAIAHCNIANVMIGRGDWQMAVSEFRQAVKYDTNFVEALQPLAWIEATHVDPRLRDGAEALRVAGQAAKVTEEKNPVILDTLAAAYAETGQFENATQTAQKAIDIALAANERGIAEDIRSHQRAFQAGRPWREK